jgi:hypothetical protein
MTTPQELAEAVLARHTTDASPFLDHIRNLLIEAINADRAERSTERPAIQSKRYVVLIQVMSGWNAVASYDSHAEARQHAQRRGNEGENVRVEDMHRPNTLWPSRGTVTLDIKGRG